MENLYEQRQKYDLQMYGNGMDWYLQHLIELANRESMQIGLTLTVPGGLVTGTLVSGRKYFNEFARIASESIGGDNKQDFYDAFASHGDLYDRDLQHNDDPPDGQVKDEESEADDDRVAPQFIHMIDVRYLLAIDSVLPTGKEGLLWRGRVNAVSSFSLGRLADNSSEQP